MMVALVGGVLALSVAGCGSDMRFAGPPQAVLQGGVSVIFQDAKADGDTFAARFTVTNLSNQEMSIRRGGWALRLPDGQLVQWHGQNLAVYRLQPGQSHAVHVNFEDHGLNPSKLERASVVVGGISYATDPIERVVGEIPLTNAGPID